MTEELLYQSRAIRVCTLRQGDVFQIGPRALAFLYNSDGVVTYINTTENNGGMTFTVSGDILMFGCEARIETAAVASAADVCLVQVSLDRFEPVLAEDLTFLYRRRISTRRLLGKLHGHNFVFHAPENRDIVLHMEVLLQDARRQEPLHVLQMDLTRLTATVARSPVQEFEPLSEQISASFVGEILKYIRENYATASLKDYAARIHYHPDYLSALLKKATGRTFRELLDSRRAIISRRLLKETELNEKEIAAAVGFNSYSGFYRFFTAYVGMTPSQFRGSSRISEGSQGKGR